MQIGMTKHAQYNKGAGVLGMVQIEFLEVKLLNFVKIAHFCALGQIRVKAASLRNEPPMFYF